MCVCVWIYIYIYTTSETQRTPNKQQLRLEYRIYCSMNGRVKLLSLGYLLVSFSLFSLNLKFQNK